MTKHIIYILLLLTGISATVSGQSQPLYSQFTFNRYLFNPAAAGSDHTTMIKATGYEQWVGFKGAPKFHTLSFDSRIFTDSRKPRRNIKRRFKLIKPGSVGAGAIVFNEKYGPLSHTGVAATYSYHIDMRDRQLSFGVSPVLSNLGLKSSDIILPDDEFDDLLVGDNTRRWIMDFNFGIYLMEKSYFAGYSIHHLTGSVLQWGGSIEDDYQLKRNHYLMGGYRYDISPELVFEPAAMLKIPEGGSAQFDLSLKTIYRKDYWFGLSYKTSRIMSVFGGLMVDRYYFCYAFDYNVSKVGTYSYGSHEILLGVRLGEMTKRYRWLNTY